MEAQLHDITYEWPTAGFHVFIFLGWAKLQRNLSAPRIPRYQLIFPNRKFSFAITDINPISSSNNPFPMASENYNNVEEFETELDPYFWFQCVLAVTLKLADRAPSTQLQIHVVHMQSASCCHTCSVHAKCIMLSYM